MDNSFYIFFFRIVWLVLEPLLFYPIMNNLECMGSGRFLIKIEISIGEIFLLCCVL